MWNQVNRGDVDEGFLAAYGKKGIGGEGSNIPKRNRDQVSRRILDTSQLVRG